MSKTADQGVAGAMPRVRRFLAWWGVPLLSLLLLAGYLYGPAGSGSGSSTRLTAVLTFVGVLVTYSASMIGYSLQHQTEKRLELDAAMRAGQLITPGTTGVSGKGDSAALASGLLALVNLNQADLAVSLLVDLWSDRIDDDGAFHRVENRPVANEIAILVINGALSSDQPSAQLIAAELLCRNATKLTATQSLHWPAVLDGGWRPEFGARTKLLLVEALVNMTTCPTKQADEAALRSVAVRLYGISRDPDDRVKACVGKLIGALIDRLERCESKEFAQGNVMVGIESLRAAAAHPEDDQPDGYLSHLSSHLAERLRTWAKKVDGIPTTSGCLATAATGSHFAVPRTWTRPARRRFGARSHRVAE